MNERNLLTTNEKAKIDASPDISETIRWPTLFPKLRTIQARFLAVNVPLVLLSLLIVIGGFEFIAFRVSVDHLNKRLDDMAQSQSAVIAESLWHLDYDRVGVILEAIIVDTDIVGAAVDDEGGQRLAAIGDLSAPIDKPNIVHRHNISFRSTKGLEKIGRLTLIHTDKNIIAEAKQRALWGLILGVLLMISTVVSAIVANWQSIGLPLSRLLGAINDAEESHSHAVVEWNTRDEFGELVAAFNRMQVQQRVYEADLREARQDLEQRVVERTRELSLARDDAETASRAKTQFLRSMSHELRTPLNAIIGFSDLIRMTHSKLDDPVKHKEYAEDINKSAHFLLEIINDLLDLSRIEGEAFQPDDSYIAPLVTINESLDMVRAAAQAKSIEIADDLPSTAPTIRADERMLKQVLLNVLSNAVKFTDEDGRIAVSINLENDGGLCFRIADNGRGIDPADLENIFKPFGRIVNPLVSREEGTGLGLPLAKSMMELHGGTLELQSKPAIGTTANIRIPRERVHD